MKYWRVVRRWAQDRYGLTYPMLEMLLFLYSEGKFSRTDFNEYSEIFPWRLKDFEKLREEGFVYRWRNRKGKEVALYALTPRAVGIIKSIYRKLNGEEAFSETRGTMFSSNARFRDKVLRNYIKKINKEIRSKG